MARVCNECGADMTSIAIIEQNAFQTIENFYCEECDNSINVPVKTEGGIKMLNEFVKEVHENAVEHGWWEEERSFGEIVALCHSELSEALEEHRNGHKPTEMYFKFLNTGEDYTQHIQKPEGIPVELADCIIRILDYCGKAEIDIDEALRIKHQYNKSRPYRHGGKVI